MCNDFFELFVQIMLNVPIEQRIEALVNLVNDFSE